MKYTATVGAKQATAAQNWYDEHINNPYKYDTDY